MPRAFVTFLVMTALVVGFARPEPAAASIAEALPPEVAVFVDVPNVPALRALDGGTAYGAIMAEDQVKAFTSEGFPALKMLAEAFAAKTGRGFSEILDLCKGEAALAVFDQVSGPGMHVFIVEVGSDTAAAKKFIDETSARLSVAWNTEEIPGTTVKWTNVGMLRPAYAFAGKYLLLSASPDNLKTVAAGLLSGRSKSLANDSLYVKSTSPAAVEQAEIIAYFNLNRLADQALPPVGRARRFYQEAGLGSAASAVYTSKVVAKGFVDNVFLYFPEGRKGVFAALSPVEDDYEKHLSKIPAEVVSASWTHMDLPALYDVLAGAVKNALPPPKAKRAEEAAAKIEADLGFSLRDDLLGSLGHNIITYTPKPSQMLGMALSGGIGQPITMLEIADEERFGKALDAVWTRLEELQAEETTGEEPAAATMPFGGKVVFSRQPFGGNTIYVARINLGPKVPVQLTPAMAISGGWLVVGMHSQSVKNVLSMPAGSGTSILSNPAYTSAAKITGAANAGASFADTRALFDGVYSLLGIGMPIAMARFGGQVPIEQALLPQSRVISSHLFASAASVTVAEDSIRMTSFGPVGNARATYLTGVTVAALGVWYQEIRRAPPSASPDEGDVEVVKSELATIGRGLFLYSRSHEGEFPPSLSTLADMGLLEDEDVDVDLRDYTYVPGLTMSDDERLIIVFARQSGPTGRGVLLRNMTVMNLSDTEVAEQVGGWLDLPDDPTADQLDAACTKNLEILARSAIRFAETHDGRIPNVPVIKADYRFAPLLMTCPAATAADRRPHYALCPGSISSVPEDHKAGRAVVFETGQRHSEGPGVAFLDGSVKRMSTEEIRELLRQIFVE